MLYYSGVTRRIGNVDEGSTVTDFLPAERARGITIQSAAITFHWPPLPPANTASQPPQPAPAISNAPRSSTPHNINLIDTPGHADFTFEVLRSLRVLDGARAPLASRADDQPALLDDMDASNRHKEMGSPRTKGALRLCELLLLPLLLHHAGPLRRR